MGRCKAWRSYDGNLVWFLRDYVLGGLIRALTGGGLHYYHSRGPLLSAFVSSSTSVASDVSLPADEGGGKGGVGSSKLKLRRVREELCRLGLDAFLVPSGDPHLSEYAADHFCRRAYISGFDGSAGTVLVTQEKALLWTDGRYFLQAEQQLGPGWELMRDGQKDVPNLTKYLEERLPAKAVLGLDPTVHSAKFVSSLLKALTPKNIAIRPLGPGEMNPIDKVWGADRPPAPNSQVRVHPIQYAGETVKSKLTKIGAQLEKEGAHALVVNVLDEVAWLLNVRGADVPNCPLVTSYALVELVDHGKGGGPSSSPAAVRARLFIDASKVDNQVRQHLAHNQVELCPYDEVFEALPKLVRDGKKIWIDPDKTNYAILKAADEASLEKAKRLKEGEEAAVGGMLDKPSPITPLKAVKNPVELEGMREAHLRDGAAVVEFLCWLEKTLGERPVSELEIDEVLTSFRARRPKYLDLSFPTIAGVGSNGAIIHYRATPSTCQYLDRTKMLLLDSGAQYEDGTTDVTRTMHFGQPTEFQKECFTRVLQGNMALDMAVFPEGTPGFVLDVLARQSLWRVGLDYAHGTGHGVGAALNVHEGPQGISFNFANQTPLQPGMILSNEPGYYAPGDFGIRTENLLVVRHVADLGLLSWGENKDPRQRKYLGFEKLTMIPICTRLIESRMLTEKERRWVDDYHSQVWSKLSGMVSDEAREWLRDATKPLTV